MYEKVVRFLRSMRLALGPLATVSRGSPSYAASPRSSRTIASSALALA